jgi:hypothetical protein
VIFGKKEPRVYLWKKGQAQSAYPSKTEKEQRETIAALFGWFGDGSSTAVRRPWFLRRHDV